jgi:hypothetical protein
MALRGLSVGQVSRLTKPPAIAKCDSCFRASLRIIRLSSVPFRLSFSADVETRQSNFSLEKDIVKE